MSTPGRAIAYSASNRVIFLREVARMKMSGFFTSIGPLCDIAP